MSVYRVRVRRSPRDLDAPEPWLAMLVDTTTGPSDPTGDVIVGRFDTMPEAITRGCTALRFVAVGIPWREGTQR